LIQTYFQVDQMICAKKHPKNAHNGTQISFKLRAFTLF